MTTMRFPINLTGWRSHYEEAIPEEQISKAIKEHEAGTKVDDLCRQLGISSGTFYNWRSKYAGL